MIKNKELRQLRIQKGWTQGFAAKNIGIQQSYLSKLENGQAVASDKTLSLISSAYGCNIGDIAFVSKHKVDTTAHSPVLTYLALSNLIIGILLFLLASFGIVQNNTAYTYQLSAGNDHSKPKPIFIVTDEFLGEKYIEKQIDDKPTYQLIGEREISPLLNRILHFVGMILFVIGLALLVVR
ncbi:XRE family transcriptional regulator, partial [Kangiella sp. HD9-110m-PIT-SAG07]